MEKDKFKVLALINFFWFLFGGILLFDWLVYHEFIARPTWELPRLGFNSDSRVPKKELFAMIESKIFYIRVFWLGFLFLDVLIMPPMKKQRTIVGTEKRPYIYAFLISCTFFLFGYTQLSFYGLFIYPLTPLVLAITAWVIVPRKFKFVKDDVIFGINKVYNKKRFHYVFKVYHKGILENLYVPRPEIPTVWEGGSGAGKSDTGIKPTIQQLVLDGRAVLLYDFDGGDRGEKSLLSTTLFNELKKARAKGLNKCKYAQINFLDPFRTVRINVLNKRYIKDRAYIFEMAKVFFDNLTDGAKSKDGFWDSYGLILIQGSMFRLIYETDEKFCTLPHLVSILLSDSKVIIEWLKDSEAVTKLIGPYLSSAAATLSSGVVTAQTPLTRLYNPKIYWIFSGQGEDEFSLDLLNHENPYCFSFLNSEDLVLLLSPVIALGLHVTLKVISKQGAFPGGVVIDELDTIKLPNLPSLISLIRKKKICVTLAFQTFAQVIERYGENLARTIRASCRNWFLGSTEDQKTLDDICKRLGKKKVEKLNFTESSSSNSTGISQTPENVLEMRDISSQPEGHFLANIANGNPTNYFGQFDYYKEAEEPIPEFSKNMKVFTGNEKLDYKIMDKIIEDRFNQIDKESNNILFPYAEKLREEAAEAAKVAAKTQR